MNKIMLAFLTLLALQLTHPTPGAAQDTYELRLYAVGAPQPQVTTPLAPAEVLCNLTGITGTIVTVNPDGIAWDDPNNPGRFCQWKQGPTGPLASRPIGSYESTIVRTTLAGTAESARAPFSKASPPAAVTGLKHTR